MLMPLQQQPAQRHAASQTASLLSCTGSTVQQVLQLSSQSSSVTRPTPSTGDWRLCKPSCPTASCQLGPVQDCRDLQLTQDAAALQLSSASSDTQAGFQTPVKNKRLLLAHKLSAVRRPRQGMTRPKPHWLDRIAHMEKVLRIKAASASSGTHIASLKRLHVDLPSSCSLADTWSQCHNSYTYIGVEAIHQQHEDNQIVGIDGTNSLSRRYINIQ